MERTMCVCVCVLIERANVNEWMSGKHIEASPNEQKPNTMAKKIIHFFFDTQASSFAEWK